MIFGNQQEIYPPEKCCKISHKDKKEHVIVDLRLLIERIIEL